MIRFLLRALGVLIAAGGFTALVIDGVKSLANSAPVLTSLGQIGFQLFGERYLQLQPAIERNLHPMLWDPVLLSLTQLPASAIGFVIGFFLLWCGQPPRDPGVGVLTRQ
jgi:hypothetical protein